MSLFGKTKTTSHSATAPAKGGKAGSGSPFPGMAKKAPRTPAMPAFPAPTQALRSLTKGGTCATCPGAKRK